METPERRELRVQVRETGASPLVREATPAGTGVSPPRPPAHQLLAPQALGPASPAASSLHGPLNVYKHSPQQLSKLNGCGEREREWYFFTTRDRKYKNGARPNREAGGRFWKATGSAEEIVHDGQVIGWKRSLVYYLGKPQNGVKTGWIMHEFTAKDADANNNYDPKRTTGENDMQLDGYVICKIHLKRSKSESKDRKGEGGENGQRKRKSVFLTKDGCESPQKDPGDRDFHAESLSSVPGPNDSAPLEPWDQAAIAAELPSVCSDLPMSEQMQQQPQATEKGIICFEHADTPNDPVVNLWPVDMFDFGVAQEQQQQTANHGALNYNRPNVLIDSAARPPHMPVISLTPGQPQAATDRAAAVNFDPANNASDDSISNGANALRGLSLNCCGDCTAHESCSCTG